MHLRKTFLNLALTQPVKTARFNHKETITFPRMHTLIDKILKLKDYPDEIDIVADFDHTLTQHRIDDEKCDSLFGMWVTNPSLNKEFKHDLIQNYKKYGPYETDSTLSF